MRRFAPAHEFDFCGHTTLATAHDLLINNEKASLIFLTASMSCEYRTSRIGTARHSTAFREKFWTYFLERSCLPPCLGSSTTDSLLEPNPKSIVCKLA
ncbi:PhzF family phenazine biosynthesis protein [Pseudomonas sp. Pseusp16]|uniref:PhzF family phenazine biosynthesis protein n=1 Tax=Pseudomonas sp. Pseusp16 TaxID=3243021 RepID=UPI0039B60E44